MVDSDHPATVDEFISTLQRAITCVSRAVVIQGRSSPTEPYYLTFAERLVPLQGRHRLALSFLHSYVLRGRTGESGALVVRSVGYWYQLHDRDGAEIIAFHWHPGRLRHVGFAHLHLAGQAGAVTIDRKRHIPTGRVSLEAVIRFAIEELHVRPLRADWQRVLDEGIEAFEAGRSW